MYKLTPANCLNKDVGICRSTITIKNANISLIQKCSEKPGISRVDISRDDLYRSTVSNIINSLIDNGVVLEERSETPCLRAAANIYLD